MKISEYTLKDFENHLPQLNDYQIDSLYLADSYGNIDLNKLELIVSNIKYFWKGDLGIHAHDNMHRAL